MPGLTQKHSQSCWPTCWLGQMSTSVGTKGIPLYCSTQIPELPKVTLSQVLLFGCHPLRCKPSRAYMYMYHRCICVCTKTYVYIHTHIYILCIYAYIHMPYRLGAPMLGNHAYLLARHRRKGELGSFGAAWGTSWAFSETALKWIRFLLNMDLFMVPCTARLP